MQNTNNMHANFRQLCVYLWVQRRVPKSECMSACVVNCSMWLNTSMPCYIMQRFAGCVHVKLTIPSWKIITAGWPAAVANGTVRSVCAVQCELWVVHGVKVLCSYALPSSTILCMYTRSTQQSWQNYVSEYIKRLLFISNFLLDFIVNKVFFVKVCCVWVVQIFIKYIACQRLYFVRPPGRVMMFTWFMCYSAITYYNYCWFV